MCGPTTATLRSTTFRNDAALGEMAQIRYLCAMIPSKAPTHRLKFVKAERLRHRTLVEGLFQHGKSLYEYPLRLTYRIMSGDELSDSFRKEVPEGIARMQMMVTVPKKKRRHAVDRVLMRRRIREAFRLNRIPLRDLAQQLPDGAYLQLAFIYLHNENADYRQMENCMIRLLDKLAKKIGIVP